MRRGLIWAVTLPLVLLGTQAAHALAYNLVDPQAHERVLRATGHGYLTWLPRALGVAGAVALAALCVVAVEASRGRRKHTPPAWAFALLPPATFVIQEVLELSLHTGRVNGYLLLAPTFLPGLLLQLPLAFGAYVATRFLLRTAERIGRTLTKPRTFAFFVQPLTAPTARLLRARVVVAGCSSRGPPPGIVAN